MSNVSKANAYLAAAAAALGVTMTVDRPAVAETMLDQFTVASMGIAQVNDAGACVVIVTVNSGADGAAEVRVVGDANGAAKLYSSIGATESIIKSAKISATTAFSIKRKLKAVTVGSPTNELKALHKAAVKEAASYSATFAKQESERLLAVGQGWDVSVGTPYRDVYDNIVKTQASVHEVKLNALTKADQYATLLLGAGINPTTYQPIAVSNIVQN